MDIYKHGKLIAVSAVMLLGLAACNNNNDEALDLRDNRMTTLGKDRTSYLDNDTKRLKEQNGRSETSAIKRSGQNRGNGTSEILQTPDGFLTIDPNSYSTGIPSSKFPHTEMNRQGRLTYEDWQRAQRDTQERLRNQFPITAPEGAAPAPEQGTAPTPDLGEAPAPEQAAPAPNQGTAPAPTAPTPEQEAAPAPAPTEEAAPAPEQKATPSGTELSAFESRVIDLTNEQRRKNGLQNLQPDTALSNVAQEKSNDMQAKNYFSHTSPTYGSPFDMMRDFGVTYQSAGENIAMGQQSAEEVVNAWMNSEGHRKNILSPNFTHIGVGHTGSGNYWTQMFIGK
ncbi:CAP domain-containing protein [Mesobacillus subterraneus]|nr:CAP domain-containing protein [Mesobacillus subterraneus]MCM3663066.1 CAP domain-containing protein [Mesobacillus subterraneus]MCM3682758.1 CAP domain-containing protein [Mesobacillus subterraneus]